ncbi:MAG TPA: epimerase, partial [bacterium]|nr:epimerase [bacterium]
SGRATSVRELYDALSSVLEIRLAPSVRGEFRPGEIRHLTADISRARAAGYAPKTDLGSGIARYIDWIRAQADVRDYFAGAETVLRTKGVVHRVESA